jgi:hypothetical protein
MIKLMTICFRCFKVFIFMILHCRRLQKYLSVHSRGRHLLNKNENNELFLTSVSFNTMMYLIKFVWSHVERFIALGRCEAYMKPCPFVLLVVTNLPSKTTLCWLQFSWVDFWWAVVCAVSLCLRKNRFYFRRLFATYYVHYTKLFRLCTCFELSLYTSSWAFINSLLGGGTFLSVAASTAVGVFCRSWKDNSVVTERS